MTCEEFSSINELPNKLSKYSNLLQHFENLSIFLPNNPNFDPAAYLYVLHRDTGLKKFNEHVQKLKSGLKKNQLNSLWK